MGIFTILVGLLTLFFAYVALNDRKLRAVPPEAIKASPERWTEEEVQKLLEKQAEEQVDDLTPYLEEKTGRRYIVVGGAGFLGGWIVLHLLKRGESPENIRILDIRPPSRLDLQSLLETTALSFVKTDITNPDSLRAAFATPWPKGANLDADVTLFHTAANIRYFERSKKLLHLSKIVNVQGTKNVVKAAKEAGDVTIYIYTSSGSIGIRNTRFLLWPWENRPKYGVQHIGDDPHTNGILPTRHEEHYGNYPVSKREADLFVLGEDMGRTATGKTFRTGCLRPSNGVYGPGGDTVIEYYMRTKSNPAWDQHIVSSFIYIENCSLAHLAYERSLLSNAPEEKGFGGRSYCITDGGLPPRYADLFTMVNIGTHGETTFPAVSPTAMLIFAHAIEALYNAKRLLPAPFSNFVPNVPPVMHPLQPPTFSLTLLHTVFDDSRARKEIGYRTPWTTKMGVWETVRARNLGEKGKGFAVSWKGAGGGVPVAEVSRAVNEVIEKVPGL